MPRSRGQDAAATELALKTLAHNRRTGTKDGFAYDFTCPSPSSYPFQWAWDSCFHAIALARTDISRARAELESLLHGVDAEGFLPHMLLWQDDLRVRASQDFRMAVWDGWKSVSVAPPVLARAIERVHAADEDEQWLRRVLPAACRFYDWLHRTRRTSTALLAIHHPDESGLDMSPKYDAALGLVAGTGPEVSRAWHARMSELLAAYRPGRRPDSDLRRHGRFHWADVLFNSIYADGLVRLARMVSRAGLPAEGGRRFAERAEQVSAALMRECWDAEQGCFHDLDLLTTRREHTLTISSLFPLIVEHVPGPVARRVIDDHLTNPEEFWLPYPLPSVAANEPAFDPDFTTEAIFRGSSWVNLNWYLYWGLRERGAREAASVLATRTVAAAASAGMRECYGPYDGEGHGAVSFGWSSLVLDLIDAESPAPGGAQ
ncbi:trehalase family glycosidase [Streptomyces sp. NPDC050704]|uniref:amylo-alpha-1,6-glucosidase n=1 Tax=Streptomyces sp. NPDC050704 TaxID=3157219 RepID=UPI0034351ACD